MISNQQFCYWLQGYFEIAGENSSLDKGKIGKINCMLDNITIEPLGIYTSWLKNALRVLKENDFHQPLVEAFTNSIKHELTLIFMHIIDDSYDTKLPKAYLQHIHDTGDKPQEFK